MRPRVFGRGRYVVSIVPAEGGGWNVLLDGRQVPRAFPSLDAAWAAGASEAARLDAIAGARLRHEARGG